MNREDRPDKRRIPVAVPQSRASQPSPKKIKNNTKDAISQPTTKEEEEHFRAKTTDAIKELQLLPHSIKLRTQDDSAFYDYQWRHPLFEAIPKHLFPLITQKRHKYFQSLKSIDFRLLFNRYDEKERSLINECFTQFSLLPYLRKLHFEFVFGIDDQISEENALAVPQRSM